MKSPLASLFLSTFEQPRHLELVCTALERQSFSDFEILICDDGSGPDTKKIIDQFKARANFPVSHFWQEPKGFRKCKILNTALKKSQGKICIFLDGDCVPHKDYIRDHVENQAEGRYLAGRRVELGEEISKKLDVPQIQSGFFDYPHWSLVKSVLEKDTEHLQRTIRIASKPLRRLLGMEHIDDLKGCNYSVLRSHLVAINGFDEAYEGYGREDTDIELRLQNLGLRIKSLKGLALQFHVWHPRRNFTPGNDDRLEEVKRTGRVRCELGLDQQ